MIFCFDQSSGKSNPAMDMTDEGRNYFTDSSSGLTDENAFKDFLPRLSTVDTSRKVRQAVDGEAEGRSSLSFSN